MNSDKIVYMIDDDDEDQEIFAETLSSVDNFIQCFPFSNGSDALTQLLHDDTILPDFIFLDLNMPIMNGYEFLKEMKKHQKLNHLHVIIYTTSSEQKHKIDAIKLGASSFMTKPSDLSELRSELRTILNTVYHSL